MKRIIFAAALLLGSLGLQAQDCEALVLPRLGNDKALYDRYPEPKRDLFCMIARAAFYESDTVPQGARVYNITEVRKAGKDEYLASSFVVDLNTFSYFAYNFNEFQLSDGNNFNVVNCFSTPSSSHRYLVLRSYNEMMDTANNEWRNKYE